MKFFENILNINNKEILFKRNIIKVLTDDESYFIQLEPSAEDLNNIYSFSKFGEKKWQIKNVESKISEEYIVAPLVMMILDSDSRLFVTDFMGRRFEVNKKNGQLEKMEVVK